MMDPEDLVLANNIVPVHYNSWVQHNGLIYHSCADCGYSTGIMLGEGQARFIHEEGITLAVRESEHQDLPVYRELKELREWNINARRILEEAQQIAESDLMAVGHARDGEARTLAMIGLREWIKKLEVQLA